MRKILSFITTGAVLSLAVATVVSPLASAQYVRIDGLTSPQDVYSGDTVDMSTTAFRVWTLNPSLPFNPGTAMDFATFAFTNNTVVAGLWDSSSALVPGDAGLFFDNGGAFTAPTTPGVYYLTFTGSYCSPFGTLPVYPYFYPSGTPIITTVTNGQTLPLGITGEFADPCKASTMRDFDIAVNRNQGAWVQFNVTAIVSFDANGGIGATGPAFTDTNGDVDLPSNAFTRDGYTFQGWSTNPGGPVEYLDEDSLFGLLGNMTLYAQWLQIPVPPVNPDLKAPDTGASYASLALSTAFGMVIAVTAAGVMFIRKRI